MVFLPPAVSFLLLIPRPFRDHYGRLCPVSIRFALSIVQEYPALDRMPLDALSTYAYSPFYRGTYAVLTGSGILVKKFLLAL